MTKDYYGTKRITAWPLIGENPATGASEFGMAVKYADGYISWSPEGVFNAAYQPIDAMNFGHALQALKDGHRVGRSGWNGKGMFVVLMPALYLPPFNTQGTDRKVNDRTAKWIGEDQPLDCQPYLALYTADRKWVPGWLASQTDMLADDWQIIEPVAEAAVDDDAAGPIDIQGVEAAEAPASGVEMEAVPAAVSPHLARMASAVPDGASQDANTVAPAGPPVWGAPSVGRIVHVRFSDARSDGEHFAAIITGVRSETLVDVMVFPRNAPPAPIQSVEQGEDPAAIAIDGDAKAGVCWQWPARV